VWPALPVFSLASSVVFYKGNLNGQVIPLKDDAYITQTLANIWAEFDGQYCVLATKILAFKQLWEQDLSVYNELVHQLAGYIEDINENGMRKALNNLIKET
jgi:tagaturonate reductase